MNPPHPSRRRWLAALGIGALVALIDQGTKAWALTAISEHEVIDLVGSLRLNLAFNTGASFSMGSGLGPVIALVVCAVVVALLRFIRSVPGRLNLVAAGMVVGGAIGNLVDRIFRDSRGGGDGFLSGAVVDFLDLQWWPIFNIADVGVVVGAVLLVFGTWRLGDGVSSDTSDLQPESTP
ncbi:MAG: signal peptidase II [Acidimicrobiia bacterium]|nr:signal peptidase II [Acidimicrobiia bacterium]